MFYLNYTCTHTTIWLFWGKRNSEKCENCGVKENVEHVMLNCILFVLERQIFHDRVQEARRESGGVIGNRRRRKGDKNHQEGII